MKALVNPERVPIAADPTNIKKKALKIPHAALPTVRDASALFILITELKKNNYINKARLMVIMQL